jgi:hypothetical protein
MFGGVSLHTGSVVRKKGGVVEFDVGAAQCSGDGAFRCWLRPSLRSVLGFVGGAEWLTVNLVQRATGPHLYLLRSEIGAYPLWMS